VTRQPVYLGMTMFLLAESVFFFMLLLAFVYFRNTALSAPALQLSPAALTIGFLAASSLTMFRATASDQATRVRLWSGATILLGIGFLIGQAREFAGLLGQGISISQSLFGTTFFTLTGVHGLHVFVGILSLLLWEVSRTESDIDPRRRRWLNTVAMYWYFICATGIVIFTFTHLWGGL
jgi:heme/copper-type cytochrome/quinol oxidase subunit 3